MFRKPDLTQSKINELMEVVQEEDESIDDFMNRVKNLVQDSFNPLPEEEKQNVAVTHFCRGLLDREAARLVSVNAKGSVGEAVRIAGAATVVKARDKKNSKSKAAKAYLMQSDDQPFENEQYDDDQEGADDECEDENGEEGCYYFNSNGPPRRYNNWRRGNRTPRWRGNFRSRGRTGSSWPELCTRCGGKGYTEQQCPTPVASASSES